ncbi:MAG: hypothetical protein ACXVJM_21545 [Mucilaginibacter sp.]
MKMLFFSTVKISEKKFGGQAYKYASYMRKILVISGLMMSKRMDFGSGK